LHRSFSLSLSAILTSFSSSLSAISTSLSLSSSDEPEEKSSAGGVGDGESLCPLSFMLGSSFYFLYI